MSYLCVGAVLSRSSKHRELSSQGRDILCDIFISEHKADARFSSLGFLIESRHYAIEGNGCGYVLKLFGYQAAPEVEKKERRGVVVEMRFRPSVEMKWVCTPTAGLRTVNTAEGRGHVPRLKCGVEENMWKSFASWHLISDYVCNFGCEELSAETAAWPCAGAEQLSVPGKVGH
ncbi:unnamed protein product [Pleuronectes platessa]|uniref:Uncharacterized protein n=1 Tax=Pleuronectes platessa TaxID=8262 RepID=A0A9N7Z756_PLEPL|nr:unnamed protein product [Pleuronectes platessa]